MMVLSFIIGGSVVAIGCILIDYFCDRKERRRKIMEIARNGDVDYDPSADTYKVTWKSDEVEKQNGYLFYITNWGRVTDLYEPKSKFGSNIERIIYSRILNKTIKEQKD